MLYVTFDFVECIIDGNMALYIDNNQILYYPMDVYRSIMLGHNYFTSPIMQSSKGRSELCNCALLIVLSEPNVHQDIKFFPGIVGCFDSGCTITPIIKL